MKFFDDWKLNTKLTVSFFIIILLLVAVIIISYANIRLVFNSADDLFSETLASSNALEEMTAQITTVQNELLVLAVAPSFEVGQENVIRSDLAEVENFYDLYKGEDVAVTEEEGASAAAFEVSWEAYQAMVDKVIEALKDDDHEQALQYLAGAESQDILSAVKDLSDANYEEAQEIFQEATGTLDHVLVLMIIMTVVADAVAIGLGWLNSSSLSKPMKTMVKMLSNLGKGDLNRDIPREKKEGIARRKDEIGALGKACLDVETYMTEGTTVTYRIATGDLSRKVRPFSEKDEMGLAYKEMVQNLRGMVREVEAGIRSLNSASSKLAEVSTQTGHTVSQITHTLQQVVESGNQQSEVVDHAVKSVEQISRAVDGVALGAQEQAKSVNEANALTVQIHSAIQGVSKNARAVSDESNVAAEKTRHGSSIVEETVLFMKNVLAKVVLSADKVREMGRRSQEIGAILETIQEIAAQTNLLALNAAIEAARAGEHGKGFSVVAEEVRKLAERSKNSTTEIATLIQSIQKTVDEAVKAMEESTHEVEMGAERSTQTGGVLQEVLKAVETVQSQAQEAAAATSQMDASINSLVGSMDVVSAVVEENTSATEEISAGQGEVSHSIENIADISNENKQAMEHLFAAAMEINADVDAVDTSVRALADMAQSLQQLVNRFNLVEES